MQYARAPKRLRVHKKLLTRKTWEERAMEVDKSAECSSAEVDTQLNVALFQYHGGEADSYEAFSGKACCFRTGIDRGFHRSSPRFRIRVTGKLGMQVSRRRSGKQAAQARERSILLSPS
jgi:hypothetical protein